MSIYKHKLVPQETQDITQDHWIYRDEHWMLSTWSPAHSDMKVVKAVSIFDLEHGWQLSQKFDAQGQLKYWYCDIIASYSQDGDLHIVDLILDVVLFPDGVIQVVDMPEFQNYVPQTPQEVEWLETAPTKLQTLIHQILLNDFPSGKMKNLLSKIPDTTPN